MDPRLRGDDAGFLAEGKLSFVTADGHHVIPAKAGIHAEYPGSSRSNDRARLRSFSMDPRLRGDDAGFLAEGKLTFVAAGGHHVIPAKAGIHAEYPGSSRSNDRARLRSLSMDPRLRGYDAGFLAEGKLTFVAGDGHHVIPAKAGIQVR
jgi:uncharacterized pyridoxamine 5'-phosphate oxidase family protein